MSIIDGNDDEGEEKSKEDDDSDSMKLNRKDMDLFGFCPSRDEFTLVMCEVCEMLVKPQALKHHIEIRHGPAALNVTTSALTSELAKTLSMPVASLSKSLGSNKPPTKASLKQGPGFSHVRSNAQAGSKVSASRFRKGDTNPVVKVERIPREVEAIKRSASNSPAGSPKVDVLASVMSIAVTTTAATALSVLVSAGAVSPLVTGVSSDKLSLSNGTLKEALNASRTVVTSTTTPTVTTVATQPVALTTTTTSVTYTRPSPTPTTVHTTTSTTSMAAFSKMSKPPRSISLNSALAATLSAIPAASPIITPGGSSKSKKVNKERKFLPCKDREFDANKHCGVVIEDTGKPCTRSLTCKTHALGLRRAVPGRKKSFDDLLREHKAAKEAIMKAKAEGQAVMSAGMVLDLNSSTTAASAGVLTSPAALAAATAIKLGQSAVVAHRDVKATASALLSTGGFPQRPKMAKPVANSVFQKFPVGVSRFTSGGVFPPTLTVKEEPSPSLMPELHARLSQSSEQEGECAQDKSDAPCLNQHPRPAAMCTFGARMAGGSCALFSRRVDLVRAAFLSALERQLNPPPHKKLCVESNLPKEPQMVTNSKDPYEFTTDAGLAAHPRQSVSFTFGAPTSLNTSVLGKPFLKHKTKSQSSHSLGIAMPAVSTAMSSAATTIAIPSLGAHLLRPAKPQDSVTINRSPAVSGTITLQQSVKRKRSGSSQGGVSPVRSIATGTLQLQGLSGVGVTVSSAAGVTLSAAGLTRGTQHGLLTSVSSVNSHAAATPITAITIPSVNLANAATLGLNATLPGNKPGQKANFIKDFNFVLTGLDPSLMNGQQYVNISGAQLAELAAAQAVSATAEDKNIKRSRLANAKHGAHKVTGTLDALRALQSNSVLTMPPNAVLVEGGLQGTVLAPVSSLGGAGGGNSTTTTYVALTSSAMTTSQSSSSITVAPNTLFRAVSESGTPQQVTLSTTPFANGIISSSTDKLHVGAVSSHHQQHHRSNNNNTAGCSGQNKALASGFLQAQPLCVGQPLTAAQLAHFKPGTFNITKGAGGKLTMQPVSVTIPIMGQMGLAGALASTQQQNTHAHAHQHPQPQPTILVTTNAEDVGGGGGGNKAEIHLQSQMSSASSGMIS